MCKLTAVSSGVWVSPQRTLGDVWRHLWLLQVGRRVVTGLQWVEARDVARHPTVRRTAPTTDNGPAPKSNSADGGEAQGLDTEGREHGGPCLSLQPVFLLPPHPLILLVPPSGRTSAQNSAHYRVPSSLQPSSPTGGNVSWKGFLPLLCAHG